MLTNKYKDLFKDCEETIKFIKIFNNIFAEANIQKNMYNTPLTDNNFQAFEEQANEFITYILSLRNANGCKIIHSQRKTGFLRLNY